MVTTRSCLNCGGAVTGQGEHIWPAWYLNELDRQGRPPLAWSANGQPIVNRKGTQMHPGQRQRVFAPVCPPCNATLNIRFEVPARPIIWQVLTHGWNRDFTLADWRAIGDWYAKILLLLGRPDAEYSNPTIDAGVVTLWDAGTPDTSWLFNGSAPPDDLSLWVFNASPPAGPAAHGIVVPRYVTARGADPVAFHFLQAGLDGICVALLSHPGWPVDHPLVVQGQAWELLHNPPSNGNLSHLPQLNSNVISWYAYDMVLADGFGLGTGLPPLRAGDPPSLPTPEVMDVLVSAQPVGT